MTPRKIARARERYDQGDLTVAEIAKSLGASRASVTANCLRRTMGAFNPYLGAAYQRLGRSPRP